MRNTYYGDLQGRFEGTGWPLFARGVLMWFLAVVPTTAGALATIGAVDWDTLSKDRPATTTCSARSPHRAWAKRWVMRSATLIWMALVDRHPLSHLPGHAAALVGVGAAVRRRGGDVAAAHRADLRRLCPFPRLRRPVHADLGPGRWSPSLYRWSRSCSSKEDHSTLSEIIATVALVGAYVVAALGYSTIYQATVRLGLWRVRRGIARHLGCRRARACLRRRRAELADRRRTCRRAGCRRAVTIRDFGA